MPNFSEATTKGFFSYNSLFSTTAITYRAITVVDFITQCVISVTLLQLCYLSPIYFYPLEKKQTTLSFKPKKSLLKSDSEDESDDEFKIEDFSDKEINLPKRETRKKPNKVAISNA